MIFEQLLKKRFTMNKTIWVIVMLLFSSLNHSLHAQMRVDPSPEEKLKAKNLAKKYKNDKYVKVVVLDGDETYKYKYNRKSKNYNIELKGKQTLMGITDNTTITKTMYYDNYSGKVSMRFKNKLNKRFDNRPKDEYVNINGLFYHDTRVVYANLYFPMLGYINKYEFKKTYYDPKYFTTVYFTGNQPVIKKTIKFIIPKTVDVSLKEMNFDGFNIQKKKYYSDKEKANVIEYTVKDLPADYQESHMQGPSYIYPHVLVLTKSYTDKANQKHTIFAKTDDLYKWYHSLTKRLREKPMEYSAKVRELTSKGKTKEEKIKNIFYWVQDNIRYIAFEDGLAGFKPDESQNVYNKRYGDCKGMANLLTGMLKKAGFDAHRTWLGTRHIAYDYSTPSLSVDNHMICTLFLNGKPYYLDATESYVPFGEYAERIQGRQVMIENGKKYMLKKVPEHKAEHNKKTYQRTMKVDGDNLVGHVKEVYKGQSRTYFLQAYNSIKSDKKKDAIKYYIKGDDGNYVLKNIKTSDLNNREKDFDLNYDFTLKNAVSAFDDEMYIDIDYDKDFGGLDFKDRKTAYEFHRKPYFESKTVLEIPANYKFSELPQNLHANNEDFQVDIDFKVEGNKLIYTKKFVFPNALIHKKNIKAWQKVYKQLDNIYQTQLTLIKK